MIQPHFDIACHFPNAFGEIVELGGGWIGLELMTDFTPYKFVWCRPSMQISAPAQLVDPQL